MPDFKADAKGNRLPRPPYHPQIAALIETIKPNNNLTQSDIPALRAQTSPTAESVIGNRPIQHKEYTISSSSTSATITLSLFTKTSTNTTTTRSLETLRRPCIYHIHGGGLVAGNRFLALTKMLDWVSDLDILCASIEYRLAPENPYPAALTDCEDGLAWLHENADALSIDKRKICLVAGSGGATLAVGLSLKLRHRRDRDGDGDGQRLAGMLLYSPMLDHRLQSESSHQFVDGGVSDRRSAEKFWAWYLGGEAEKFDAEAVDQYASFGTVESLEGLPPIFIDIGACDVHRDEAVEFASKIWRDGGECELHVWPGGCHIFFVLIPDLEISKECVRSRKVWIKRILYGE